MRWLALILAVLAFAPAAHARDVVLVANAEGGTVSIVDATRFTVLKTIDVLPDGRTADHPEQALVGQRIVEAAGGTNFAQDQDISPDGRTLYVSRGHRGDVAAFDLASGRLLWKRPIPGLRSDHMTISEDGARLYVSALTDNRVHVVDTRTHAITGSFATGEWPHDNHLSHDGSLIYNGSIGNIVTPAEARAARPGTYRLTIADARTLETKRTIDLDRGIRPYVLTHDERTMFTQLSEFHGLAQLDLASGEVVRRKGLPIDPGVTEADYDFEAPHHGLAMSPDERTLCVAGRASDYVALVDTQTLEPTATLDTDDAPGWAANGPDGTHCFVPNTRADTLSVVSYAQRRIVAKIRVGDGPKQIEAAKLPEAVLREDAADRAVPRLTRRCIGNGRLRVRVIDVAGRVDLLLGDRRVRRLDAGRREVVIPRRSLARTRATTLRARPGAGGPVLRRSLPRCGLARRRVASRERRRHGARREAPIVVGARAIALRDLERRTRELLPVLVDPETARGQAASDLIAEAWRRAEAARRGLRMATPIRIAAAIAAGTRDPLALARRFEAYDRRWSAQTRCTPRWSLAPPCTTTPVPCVWAGAADVCTIAEPADPGERPYWSVQLSPPAFGLDEDGADLTRRITKRIADVPGLRRRLGEILNEGEVSIFALSRRDAWLVAREALVLRAALARRADRR